MKIGTVSFLSLMTSLIMLSYGAKHQEPLFLLPGLIAFGLGAISLVKDQKAKRKSK